MAKKKPTPSPVSDPLRRAIRDSGLPLAHLQRETGVQRESIARFLRGESSLVLDKADKLARYFGLQLTSAKE